MSHARTIRQSLAGLIGVLALTAAQAAPGAHGPGGEHLAAPGGAVSASGLARLPDGSVTIPKAAQRRMNIRTALSVETSAAATLELPAVVVIDPNAGGRVQTIHGGRVEAGNQGLATIGKAVRRGEVLGYVRYAGDPYALAGQQAQLAELRARRLVAEQRAARLARLEGSVARKDIDAAQAEAQALVEQERSIGAGIGAREALRSPVAGIVARADAIVGQVVEPRDILFEIIDPQRLMVEASIADPALAGRVAGAALKEVGTAQLTLVGAGAALREGRLPLRFSVKAKERLPLAVGQPVSLVVRLNEEIKGIVLPASAVVRNPANEPIVWIKSGAHRFVPQPVRFRTLDAERVVITHGLGADNRVVTEGAALVAQIR
ncbi:MAG: efflux RND transporter periplasmic adaptor subunit [Rhodocyclaceae bacterium]